MALRVKRGRIFTHSFIYPRLFINIKLSMLLIGSQGMLNSVYIREDYIGLE
jgi:hypothetical protein